jgi:rubrerythrin
MPEKKDFCTLLSEQIIDERKAVETYSLLLNLFDGERDLLVPNEIKGTPAERIFRGVIEEIASTEGKHAESLEHLRKEFCVPKEK